MLLHHVPLGALLGALLSVIIVQALQVGSIEGATGSIGRTLQHSVAAHEACSDRIPSSAGPSSVVITVQQAYQAALERLAASGVPGNKQPGGLTGRLLRGGDNALEALGGRIPPERALQLFALTVPLRTDGPLRRANLEPAPITPQLCR